MRKNFSVIFFQKCLRKILANKIFHCSSPNFSSSKNFVRYQFYRCQIVWSLVVDPPNLTWRLSSKLAKTSPWNMSDFWVYRRNSIIRWVMTSCGWWRHSILLVSYREDVSKISSGYYPIIHSNLIYRIYQFLYLIYSYIERFISNEVSLYRGLIPYNWHNFYCFFVI